MLLERTSDPTEKYRALRLVTLSSDIGGTVIDSPTSEKMVDVQAFWSEERILKIG